TCKAGWSPPRSATRPCRRAARSPCGIGAVAADHTDHAGAADAGDHLVTAEGLELLTHRGGGAVHVVEEFRMSVDIVTPGRDLAVQIGDAIDDRHSTLAGHGRRTVRRGVMALTAKIGAMAPV